MALSNDIISQFVELTKTSDKIQNEASVYGTIVTDGENTYVKLDGSEQLTPIETTTNVAGGERVIVRIKDHKATVTGNITSPSVNNGQLEDVKDQITEFEVVIAERVTANEIVVGKIEADNVIINKKLTAIEGEFETIKADNITINEKLTANEAAIADLDAKKLSAETADLKYATIGGLNAANAEINDLKANHAEFSEATIKRLEADEASIKKLDTEKLSAKDADIKYANIDFANISMAAVEKLFAESGIIKDLVVGDTSITGELVGVTIKGDLIEANTLVADKLVIKGSDGLYYKLNTDGMTTEAEQTEYNSLNGSIITAKSITASKINVKDLVAFGATIGGFKINQNAIYSGAKEGVNNTTRGIYMDSTGQLAIGDSDNYMKFFKDTDGTYKLIISANSIRMGATGQTIEDAIKDVTDKVDAIEKPEIGGTNLMDGTTDEWVTKTVTNVAGVVNRFPLSSIGIKAGDNLTVSMILKAINKDIATRIDFYTNTTGEEGKVFIISNDAIKIGNEGKSTLTCKVPENCNYLTIYIANRSSDNTGTNEQYKCLMVEKGNVSSEWKLSQNDVLNKIPYGDGRNLALNTKKLYLERFNITNNQSLGIGCSKDIVDLCNQNIGKKLIISCDTEWRNITSADSSGRLRVGAEFSVRYEDGTYGYCGVWEQVTVGSSKEKFRDKGIGMLITKKVASVSGSMHIQAFAEYIKIANVKLEIGNICTNWSPAPEDVNDYVSIGGGNIVPDGDFRYGRWKHWINYNAGVTTIDVLKKFYKDKNCILIDTKEAATDVSRSYITSKYKVGPIRVGDTYTFSFKMKRTSTNDVITGNEAFIRFFNESGTAVSDVLIIKYPAKSDNWQTVSMTATIHETSYLKKDVDYYVSPIICQRQIGQLYITDVQLESGSIVTDWKPRAEDALENEEYGGINLFIKKNAKRGYYLNKSGTAIEEPNWFFTDYISVKDIRNLKVSGFTNLGQSPSVIKYGWDKSFISGQNNNGQSLGENIVIENTDIGYVRMSGQMKDIDTYKVEKGTKATSYSPAPEDVEDSMNNKIDNIKIGGENLIFREKYWQTTTPTVVQLTAEPEHSRIRIKKVTADAAKHVYLNFVKTLTKGKTYTLSYDIYTDMPITSEQLLFLRCNGNGQALQYMKDQIVSSINTWIHKELTFVCNHSGTDDISIDSLAFSTTHFNEGQTILFRNVKLEEGNKATTYSYAPEDERLEASRAGVNMLPNTKSLIVTGLTGVNYKYERRDIVTAINLKPFTIYTVSFKCKVLFGSTTKCSVGVTNSKIDIVYQRSDLTITDDRMSWTFYTRNATNCSTLLFYAGQAGQTGTNKLEYSEIMLEETSIASEKWIPNAGDVEYVIESKKVAVNNLILNTKNMKDTSGWTGNINIGQSAKINEPTFYNKSSTTSEVVAGTSRFRVKPNTKYCFSMLLYINKNCKSVDVWWIAKFKDSTNSFDNTIQFIKEWQEVRGNYTRVVGTFTTGPNDYDGYIRIDNNGKTDDATDESIIYWTEAMVAEGDVFAGYSPSIEDMNLRVTKAESDLTVVNNAISAKVWGEDINVALGRQADNLVRNGNGGTKDNSNFSQWTFVGDVRGSKNYPSFLKPHPAEANPLLTNDRIYIDRSKDYVLSYEIRAKLADATNKVYFCVCCYDIDGQAILPQHFMYISGTTTKLKKTLKNGDTTIEVESLDNWLTSASVPGYQRNVMIWDYEDSTGYQYPPMTYTRPDAYRNGTNGMWDSISDTDKAAGIIRLRSPWVGGTHAAGTFISQNTSGSSYMYVGATGLVSFNDRWIPYNNVIPGSSFRPGTAFVKLGIMGNQPVYLSNLYFGIDRATSGQINDLSNTVTNVQKTVSQHTIDLSGITSKVEKIESSDFQVHNLQRHSGGKYKNAGIEAWNMSGKDTLSWFTNYGSPGTFADYYDLYKGGSSGGIYAYSQSPIPVTAGEKYTVSFNYGRSAVGGATHRFVIQCSNTYPFGSVTQNVVDRYMPSTQANTIIRQEFQITIPDGVKSIKVVLVNSVSGANQSCSFYIDKIMINKGLVAYDWSPHEYDIESQFKSVEQKITAESILTTISSGINGNKGSINTMQFLLDKDGATIKNGALTILNNAGAQVLKGDADGNLMFSGYLSIIDQTSKKVISKLWGKQFAVEGAYRSATVLEADSDVRISCLDRDKDIFGQVENEVLYRTKMPYFDPSDWSTILRWDECVYLTSQETLSIQAGSSSLNKDYNNPTGQLTLMVWYPIKDDGSGATVSQTYLELLPGKIQTNKPFYPYPSIKMEESVPIHFFNSNPAKNKSGNRIDRISSDFEILRQQGPYDRGGCDLRLGCVSEDQKYRQWEVSIDTTRTYIHNSLGVGGTKNRIVETEHYGNVAMNAYETSDALFGDVGEAIIGEDGLAYIMFDEQFLETVNTKFGYNVFLQKYCKNDVWIKERTLTYFVVEGDPGTEFSWHVMAKQKGYEVDRMESFEVPDSQPVFDMTDEEIFGEKDQMAENGYKYIEDFEKEMY